MLYTLVLSSFIAFVFSQEPPDFTENDFDVRVAERTYTLIMFHAPWCGHCKKLKPEFKSAAKSIHSTRDDVRLAFVDCTTNEKICSRFDVSGYPTLKLFRNGEKFRDYDGERTENGIRVYIKKWTRPSTIEIKTADDFQKLLDSTDALYQPTIISYISPSDSVWSEKYSELAQSLLGLAIFVYSNEPSVIGITNTDSVVRLYRPRGFLIKSEDPHVNFDGPLEKEEVKKWILKSGQGRVGYRTPQNMKYFPMKNLLVLYNNVSAESYIKGVNYYRNRLIRIIGAPSVEDKLVYAYSFTEDFHDELSSLYEDKSFDFPVVMIYSGGKKYLLKNYSPDSLTEFLKGFFADTLTPYIKSEPVPTDNSEPLKKVVGRTFEEIVNDKTKDVLVMFHAPWCGHCKQLMPKFKEAAEKLKDEPNLLLVIYDATANEIFKPYVVRGYPTLYFAPMKQKPHPKEYTGGRELDDLIKYVARESTEELKGFDREGLPKKSEL